MKKSLIVFVIAIVALIATITVPVNSAHAASDKLATGIFDVNANKYYTFPQFIKLSTKDKIALVKDRKVVSFYKGKVISFLELVSADKIDITKTGESVADYEKRTGTNLLDIQNNKVDIPPVEEEFEVIDIVG